MKLIKPSFEIIPQSGGLDGIYKQIELAGRTCYKSEDKITEDSAKEFVDRMIKSGHGAMLEHGTVYLYLYETSESSSEDFEEVYNIVKKYEMNPFSKVSKAGIGTLVGHKNSFYITTNYRVLVENDWLEDLKYLCEPTEYHEKRVTVKFITDQGILREFTRHRVFSFAVESTRYCNYTKDKFNNEIIFIQPCWDTDKTFHLALEDAEMRYFQLIYNGWKPQQARNVLPLATKCDMVMTGFVSDWKHFFFLRDAVSAHPQARELAEPLHSTFIQREYINA